MDRVRSLLTLADKGKPGVTQGRKATGPTGPAGLPKKGMLLDEGTSSSFSFPALRFRGRVRITWEGADMKTKYFRGFRPERRRSFPVFAIPIIVAIFALVMQPVVNYFDASSKELRVNTGAGNGTGPVVGGTQISQTPAKVTIHQPHRGNTGPGYGGPGYGTDRSPDQRVPAASVSGAPVLPSATK